MQALEFETSVSNGMIVLPARYRHIDRQSVRVIVLLPEGTATGNYRREALLTAVANARAKGVLKGIGDAVAWQKGLRDEWE